MSSTSPYDFPHTVPVSSPHLPNFILMFPASGPLRNSSQFAFTQKPKFLVLVHPKILDSKIAAQLFMFVLLPSFVFNEVCERNLSTYYVMDLDSTLVPSHHLLIFVFLD